MNDYPERLFRDGQRLLSDYRAKIKRLLATIKRLSAAFFLFPSDYRKRLPSDYRGRFGQGRQGGTAAPPPNPSGTQPGKGAASTLRRPALRRENTPKPPHTESTIPQNQHKGQNKARHSFFMPQAGECRVQNKNAAERLKMPFSAAGKNKRRRPSPAAPCRTKKKGRSPKAAPKLSPFYALQNYPYRQKRD